jgi:hypothetical protein
MAEHRAGQARQTGLDRRNSGAAITGFVNGALEKSGGAHPDVQPWYAWFLQNVVRPNADLWSALVTFVELFVGFALSWASSPASRPFSAAS